MNTKNVRGRPGKLFLDRTVTMIGLGAFRNFKQRSINRIIGLLQKIIVYNPEKYMNQKIDIFFVTHL